MVEQMVQISKITPKVVFPKRQFFDSFLNNQKIEKRRGRGRWSSPGALLLLYFCFTVANCPSPNTDAPVEILEDSKVPVERLKDLKEMQIFR